jgi:long-subunit acyl-CoA synthetase (AMP-forming)
MANETVLSVLAEAARRFPERPAMRVKRDGAWVTTTWRQYQEQAIQVAAGFLDLGLAPGKAVAILGYNRPEWFLADLGAIAAGGVPAGIYTTSTPAQCRYIAAHSEAAIAVVENQEGLERFLAVRDELPDLRAIVVMDPPPGGGPLGDRVFSWSELLARGERGRDRIEALISGQRAADPATLIYTSGTTGEPKAVMLSHRNLVWTAARIAEAFAVTPDDCGISYLPLSHIAEQVVSLHSPMDRGSCTWFAESLEGLRDNLREVRPTIFFAVPRVWEKIQAAMVAAGASAPPLRRKLVAWARRQGLAAGYADQGAGRRPLLLPVARALVHRKVRERLGFDRLRIASTSAAPIARDTLDFFLSLGIPILEVYGMSECTGPTTFSYPHKYRTGRAGVAIPGTELRTAEDGEILMRGPHVFLGYYKNPQATAETVDGDGWLHSGDVGDIDADGFLRVTDRKKELLITSGGKNIGPAGIEARLKGIAGVAQAVLVGDRRNYVAALLTLDPAWVEAEAGKLGSAARDLAGAASCPAIRAHLQRGIDRINGDLARYESVRRFVVVPAQWTVESGELTPTMKLKRRNVYQRHAADIERLYAEG